MELVTEVNTEIPSPDKLESYIPGVGTSTEYVTLDRDARVIGGGIPVVVACTASIEENGR
jgi:hypothetical protein